jgi:spermidine synthase
MAQDGPAGLRLRYARPLFIAAIGLGSFLLFLVQPLAARLVLPVLGGAPAVWNTAMLFYQTALLAGYAYAHWLTAADRRTQAAVHLLLFAAAALTLPIGIVPAGSPETGAGASLWLLQLLAISIGPLFFVISAQAPLLQAWYAAAGGPGAANPYFLYAASNAGSLAGLLCYPFLLEPLTALPVQQWLWSGLYLLLLALTGAAAAVRLRATAGTVAPQVAGRIPLQRRLHWMVLAAVPSGLMLSTTTHITTDIMAMPLLWVIPLAAYLVSFILVFAARGPRWTRAALGVAPVALLLFGGAGFFATTTSASIYGLASVLLLLVLATALHGTLAADRPPPAQLTTFYLWMAAGGVAGSLFPALIAPRLFDWTYEHPLLLLATALLLPARPLHPALGRMWWAHRGWSRLLRIATPGVCLIVSWWLGAAFQIMHTPISQIAAVALLAAIGVAAIGRPILFTWVLAMLMLALGGWQQIDISTIPYARQRSFFGIYTIENSQSDRLRRLLHGTTLHGAQSLDPALATHPMTYYAPQSGVGRALAAAPPLFGPHARIAVVGLGTGTLACHARPGQRWTFFEIDPLIVRLATDPRIFSFLARCRPDARIIVGDARLSLARLPRNSFDMLAVDAFSSDAIPLHLLTTEAVATYLDRLSPAGVLLVHISNRYLDLEPVLAAIADRLGRPARIAHYIPSQPVPAGHLYTRSIWVAVARDRPALDRFVAAAGGDAAWAPLARRDDVRPWTDGFASVLPVMKGL